MRVFRQLVSLCAAILTADLMAADPLVLFVAGPPSHGPGEHRFPEGCSLLADALNHSRSGVRAVVSQGWPSSAALKEAQTVVIYSDGIQNHVMNGHLDALRDFVRGGKGLAVLHFALEPPPGEAADFLLSSLGGIFEPGWSVNPVWKMTNPTIADHDVTRGVTRFEIEDEWYYHLRFRSEIVPVLRALPSAETLGMDGPRSGNPAVRAELARGESQTLAWVFEKEGRRSFGFTGGHFHRNWGEPNFRKLVLNGIVWTAGVPVPTVGVASVVAAIPKYPTIDEAIARGDLGDVERHISANPALLTGSKDRALTPLHQAILRNRSEIAEWLIEKGADVNYPDRSQRTPLHLAVERGNLVLVKFLLQRKAASNERDKIGWTPLHHAAAKNQVEIARALIDGGADLARLSERGGTALHEAAASGSAEMIQMLLDHGADPTVVSLLGVTALDVAREFKNEPAIALLAPRTPSRKSPAQP